MQKIVSASMIIIFSIIGCSKKDKIQTPLPVVEQKNIEPTKSETIEFLKEELQKRIIDNYYHKPSIDFDKNGKIFKLNYPLYESVENHIRIFINNVSINQRDGVKDIYFSTDAPTKHVDVQILEFNSTSKGAIFNDRLDYNKRPLPEEYDKTTRILLLSDPRNSKILNAFKHLQQLNQKESETVSDKF
jgi:hypothetical protein